MFDIGCICIKTKNIYSYLILKKYVMLKNKTTKIIHSEYQDNKEHFEHLFMEILQYVVCK